MKVLKNFIDKKTYNFDRLIENLKMICESNLKVQVRMNMDLYNAQELFELTDFLQENFGKYKKFSLYVSPIYEDVGYESTTRTSEQRLELDKKLKELWDHIFNINSNIRQINFDVIKTHACHADRQDSTIIVPDGRLCYCEHYISSEFYGSIYDDSPKTKWCNYRPLQEECHKCPAYPSCLLMERCPSALKTCYDFDRYTKIVNLRAGMINRYMTYLENEEK